MKRVRGTLVPVAALLTAVLALAGCGGGSGDGSHPDAHQDAITATPLPSGSASPDAGQTTTIAIRIQDGQVHPDGKRVQVGAGTPVSLVITADQPGELHVHSTPEHHIEYPAGRSSATLTLDQPGIVDVESHTLDKLIVQLEVR